MQAAEHSQGLDAACCMQSDLHATVIESHMRWRGLREATSAACN